MWKKLSLADRLEARFRLIEDGGSNLAWKSPGALHSEFSARDPGPAYYALMATAGPCTTNPVWTRDWPNQQQDKGAFQANMEATGGYVFKAGTPAPRWTSQEVHQAMGPQIRVWARAEARNSGGKGHGARQDPNALDDHAMNMHAELQKMIDREKDEGRVLGGDKGFVSFVSKTVSMAGAKGIGGTDELRVARGRASQMFDREFKGYVRTPEQAREIAGRVSPEFQQFARKSFDGAPIGTTRLDPGNPYERFSPNIYQVATKLADALEAGDQQAEMAARQEAQKLRERIEDAETGVQGTHNGKRIISTPTGAKDGSEAEKDRTSFIRNTKIASMSGARTEDGGDIDIADTSHLRHLSDMDPETIYEVLKLGRVTRPEDLKHPSLAGKGLVPLSDFDLRYLIRQLANWLPDKRYPGKGVPGKDVEMPDGQPSDWLSGGQPQMWEKDEILADIGKSNKPDEEGGDGGGLAPLLAKISPAQRPYMQLYGQGTQKAEIARRLEKSKVAVGTSIKKACATLGMSEAEFLDAAKSGGASLGGGGGGGGGGEPLTKFAAWMRQYQDETALDESVDGIDFDIVWRCGRAITELHHHLVIRPLLEGRGA